MSSKYIIIVLLIVFNPLVAGSISTNTSQAIYFNISNIQWQKKNNNNNISSFEFDISINSYNPSLNQYNLSYDGMVHPFSVTITYLGINNISQELKAGYPLCCLTMTFQPGTNKIFDQEWINIYNYNSSALPDGSYIFSIDNLSSVIASRYNFKPVLFNSTLVMSHGKETVYYNSSLTSITNGIQTSSLNLFNPATIFLVSIVITFLTTKRRHFNK